MSNRSPLSWRLALVLTVLAPLPAAAEDRHACAAEAFTTVCRDGARELRVIQDTTSPSRRHGVAWEAPAAPDDVKTESDGSKHLDGGRADNVLVRLDTGKVVTKLGGEHFGDHARYNHYEVTAVWSPDSRFLALLYQSKWSTDVAAVYRLPAEGAPGKPLDLLPICRRVGASREAKLHGKSGGRYEQLVDVHSVANDGTVSAKCVMQVIKEDDDFGFAVRLKLEARGDALTARLTAARRCVDDSGPCADRVPHE